MATPDNVVLTKDGIQVTIATTRVTENWTKALTPITTPKAKGKRDINEGASTTKIVDLLMKAEKRITMGGVITTDLGAGDTSSDAYDKKEDLKSMFYAGGTLNMNWDGKSYTVGIEKCEAAWRADDKSPLDDYDILFTVIEGVDM